MSTRRAGSDSLLHHSISSISRVPEPGQVTLKIHWTDGSALVEIRRLRMTANIWCMLTVYSPLSKHSVCVHSLLTTSFEIGTIILSYKMWTPRHRRVQRLRVTPGKQLTSFEPRQFQIPRGRGGARLVAIGAQRWGTGAASRCIVWSA